jgi:hypothetical protein
VLKMVVSQRCRLVTTACRPCAGPDREGRGLPPPPAVTHELTAAFPEGFILRRQIPECAPITLDRLKTPKCFTLRGRKTCNECRPLKPFVHKTRCKPDRETYSKTRPEHSLPCSRTCKDHSADGGQFRGSGQRQTVSACGGASKDRRPQDQTPNFAL